ncbi:MAG: hypothetical protein HKN19_20215 [Halioglobus sp.]|nr:hypothetical protein [Halioglobus sp.]
MRDTITHYLANLCKRLAALACTALLAACSDGGDNPPSGVSVANLNILHGFDCDPPRPADGDQCRVAERVALLVDFLIARDCPDIVALQEIVNRIIVQRSPSESAGPLDSIVDLIEAELPRLAAACGFTYHVAYEPFLAQGVFETDEELVLSRYPVLSNTINPVHSALYDIPNDLLIFARHVLHTRIAHPAGDVDVYSTHLSSGSDDATNPCNSISELIPGTGIGPRVACPAECNTADTVRACQARQMALLVETTRGPGNLALIMGDFNAVPETSEYLEMTSRGWLDTHLAAGAAECDAATGQNCTSGRSSSAASLENPALGVNRRIDYIFAALDDTTCRAGEVAGSYQLVEGGLFADRPNPFAATCGPPPAAMCWVSDHSGNYARLRCTP